MVKTIKWLAFFTIIVLGLYIQYCCFGPHNLPTLIQGVTPPRAELPVFGPSAVRVLGDSLCSGAVVKIDAVDYVATAGHCVDRLGSLVLVSKSNWASPAQVVGFGPGSDNFDQPDWALLKGDWHGTPALEIETEEPSPPFLTIYSSRYASVPALLLDIGNPFYTFLSYSRLGESGAVILSQNGKALAILVAIYQGSPRMMATPFKFVRVQSKSSEPSK